MAVTYIHNNTESEQTWMGQTISSGGYYQITDSERPGWSQDDSVLTAVSTADAIISKTADSSGHIASVSAQIDWLKAAVATEGITQLEKDDIVLKRAVASDAVDGATG